MITSLIESIVWLSLKISIYYKNRDCDFKNCSSLRYFLLLGLGLLYISIKMPKSKSIEARPRKRKQSQRIEELTNSVSEHPKREVNHISHLSDGSRHSKLRSRVIHERSFLTDFHIVNKVPKWLILSSIYLGVLIFLMMIAFRQVMVWYQGKQVITPLHLPKVISDASSHERSHSLFWGSYRPGIYFGMKHRSPKSLLFGVMWTVQDPENFVYRHSCDQFDGVLR